MLDARACLPILTVMVYWSWLDALHRVTGDRLLLPISFLGLTLPAMRG